MRHSLRRAALLLLLGSLVAPRVAPAGEAAPLTLTRAVELALRSEEAVRIAARDLEDARLQRSRALGAALPDLSFFTSWDYSHSLAANGQPAKEGDSFAYGFAVNQPLYTGGRASSALRTADRGIRIGGLSYELAREGVLLLASGSFLDALKAERVLESVSQGQRQAREFLDLTRARFELGQVARTSILRAELELAQRENQFEQARNALDYARDSLRKVIGEDVGALSAEGIAADRPGVAPLADLVARGLASRRELAIADEGVGIAEEGVVSARGKFLPLLYAGGSYTRGGDDFFPDQSESWGGTITLSLPLYDRGLSIADLSLAKVALEKARLEREALAKRIRLEVEQAWYRLQGLTTAVASFGKQVELAEESLRGVKRQYELGLSTDLDVTTALGDLLQAQVLLAQGEYDLVMAGLLLRQASGSLRVP